MHLLVYLTVWKFYNKMEMLKTSKSVYPSLLQMLNSHRRNERTDQVMARHSKNGDTEALISQGSTLL